MVQTAEQRKQKQKEYYQKNKQQKGEYAKQWYNQNKEHRKLYNKIYKECYHQYQNTWGGRVDRNNNSLLKIDPSIFSQLRFI